MSTRSAELAKVLRPGAKYAPMCRERNSVRALDQDICPFSCPQNLEGFEYLPFVIVLQCHSVEIAFVSCRF